MSLPFQSSLTLWLRLVRPAKTMHMCVTFISLSLLRSRPDPSKCSLFKKSVPVWVELKLRKSYVWSLVAGDHPPSAGRAKKTRKKEEEESNIIPCGAPSSKFAPSCASSRFLFYLPDGGGRGLSPVDYSTNLCGNYRKRYLKRRVNTSCPIIPWMLCQVYWGPPPSPLFRYSIYLCDIRGYRKRLSSTNTSTEISNQPSVQRRCSTS